VNIVNFLITATTLVWLAIMVEMTKRVIGSYWAMVQRKRRDRQAAQSQK